MNVMKRLSDLQTGDVFRIPEDSPQLQAIRAQYLNPDGSWDGDRKTSGEEFLVCYKEAGPGIYLVTEADSSPAGDWYYNSRALHIVKLDENHRVPPNGWSAELSVWVNMVQMLDVGYLGSMQLVWTWKK